MVTCGFVDVIDRVNFLDNLTNNSCDEGAATRYQKRTQEKVLLRKNPEPAATKKK